MPTENLTDRIESDIREVEPPGGSPCPGSPITVTSANRNLLKSWLIAKGVDINRAQKASDGTLAAAWWRPAYLASMDKQKSKSFNWTPAETLDLDGGIEGLPPLPTPAPDILSIPDEDLTESEKRAKELVQRHHQIPSPSPPSSPNPQEKALSISLESLTKAADQVLNSRLQEAKRELQVESDKRLAQIQAEVIQRAKLEAEAEIARRIKPTERIIVINPIAHTKIEVGEYHHPEFPTLLTALSCGLHVMLVGGASSGKTTAARKCASVLGREFEIHGAAASAFEFKGYEDGNGTYHASPLRRAVEFGKVVLMDEYNRTIPPAQMFLQSGLANNLWPFPDRTIESHPDFLCIAADNTPGTGQSRLYNTALQQDAAALDRWVMIRWEIDEWLEAKLFGDGTPEPGQPPTARGTPPSAISPLQHHYSKFYTHLSALNKIHAVKALKEATGCDLRSCNEVVDSFLNGTSIVSKLTIEEFRDICATIGSVPSEESDSDFPPLAISLGDWVRRVQRIRRAIQDLGERHLVTMRASDYGGRLLKAGLPLEKVEDMCVWKGLGPETVEKIKHHANLT